MRIQAIFAAAMLAAPVPMTTLWAQTTITQDKLTTEGHRVTTQPRDWRHTIRDGEFTTSGSHEWISPRVQAPDAFDELIYSWKSTLGKGQGFRLELKAEFSPGDDTGWLPAGYWGEVNDLVTSRPKPTFDRGLVDMDWLRLKAKATAFQFRVTDKGTSPLTAPPSIHVVTTSKDGQDAARAISKVSSETTIPAMLLDIPLRRQMTSTGTVIRNRCQSAALASAMQYLGREVPFEEIIEWTYDKEYNYPGCWPRTVGTAHQFGLDGYIERFRDWDSVRRTIAENKVILCSIRMKEGECKSPPYRKMGDHIVVLNGMTDDGRVVITDSFLGKSGRGYRCQWLKEDFEKIWMGTKNGVAMVICSPSGGEKRLITDLPPFPKDRVWTEEDDH